nr:MAG TPA_asm: jmjN domain [Bacteriophage sp.]
MVLDKCIKVIDCKSHIEAMIQMISKNWENPTFYPTIEMFRRFREKLEELKKAAE